MSDGVFNLDVDGVVLTGDRGNNILKGAHNRFQSPEPLATTSCLSHLECSECLAQVDADKLVGLCEICGAPLLARYSLDRIQEKLSPKTLSDRSPDLWRYAELLPIRNSERRVSLGEGFTPLLPMPRLAKSLGLDRLLLKDEGQNPGGTFKARGAAVALSRLIELGGTCAAIPTNGNAGEAWAMYGAQAGLPVVVVMPEDAQITSQRICVASGAETHLVKGLISDAGQMVKQGVAEQGWFDVSTFKEPYRVEGKKTMAYEIVEQLNWNLPDVVICPTGGGMAIAAMHKGFQELIELGWVTGSLPRMVAVQAKGCAPLVDAFANNAKVSAFQENAHTFANGLRVPKSVGDRMILRILRETNGTAIAVSDEEIRAAIRWAARVEGIFLCPEAAAILPGLQKLLASGFIQPHEQVVLLGTGNGLKYTNAL